MTKHQTDYTTMYQKAKLTEREIQCADLVAMGFTNKQISDAVGIKEKTVKFHLTSVYLKTGRKGRTQLVRAILIERYNLMIALAKKSATKIPFKGVVK